MRASSSCVARPALCSTSDGSCCGCGARRGAAASSASSAAAAACASAGARALCGGRICGFLVHLKSVSSPSQSPSQCRCKAGHDAAASMPVKPSQRVAQSEAKAVLHLQVSHTSLSARGVTVAPQSREQ